MAKRPRRSLCGFWGSVKGTIKVRIRDLDGYCRGLGFEGCEFGV